MVSVSVSAFAGDTYIYKGKCPVGDPPPYAPCGNESLAGVPQPGGSIEGGFWSQKCYTKKEKEAGANDVYYWVDKWDFVQCQCTSYVAHKINELGTDFDNYYKTERWSHARYWGTRAQEEGISVNMEPIPGDVMWWNVDRIGGGYGHVAFVESVDYDSNGNAERVHISHYNKYSDSNYYEDTITLQDMSKWESSPGVLKKDSGCKNDLACFSGFIHLGAYEEGVNHLSYLDCYETQLCDYQTQEEWEWILARVNEYRCTDCGGGELAVIADEMYAAYGFGGGSSSGGSSSGSSESSIDVSISKMEGNGERHLVVEPKQEIELEVVVRNKGGAFSEHFKVKYYRSEDDNFSKDDKRIGDDEIKGLEEGEKNSERITVEASGTPGRYYYGAYADVDADFNQENNWSNADDEIVVVDVVEQNINPYPMEEWEAIIPIIYMILDEKDEEGGEEPIELEVESQGAVQ